MGARHYSTVLGRFLQKEPLNLAGPPTIAYPLSANDYVYCGNSPTVGSDISGLDSSMGLGSTMNTGILYPPEKPGPATPDEPLPDPDPWFTPIMPMVARMPGFEPPTLPPWDGRFPQIPHPSLWDIMMDISTPPGAMPAPIFPLPGGRSRPWANGPVAGRGGRGKFPLPEPMGASSGGGGGSSGSGGSSGYEKEFKYWPPGSFWGLAGDHAQKGPIDTGSGNSDSHFRMPNYGFVSMGASYGSGREQVQSEADFDKNWKNQGLSGNIRKTVALGTLAAMAIATGLWVAAPAIASAVATLWTTIATVGSAIGTGIASFLTRAQGAFSSAWGWLSSLPARIGGALSRAGSWVLNNTWYKLINYLSKSRTFRTFIWNKFPTGQRWFGVNFMKHAGHGGVHFLPHYQIEFWNGFTVRHIIGTPFWQWTSGGF